MYFTYYFEELCIQCVCRLQGHPLFDCYTSTKGANTTKGNANSAVSNRLLDS